MTEPNKWKLSGGPDKTATWIWLEEGRLKIEFYDFGEVAQKMFGNDIAYTITVSEMTKLVSITKQEQASLIGWVTESFKSYFDIKRWLEENGIDFNIEIESWA